VEWAPRVKLVVPYEPDCNLICLALNPAGNRSLRAANALTRTLYDAMSVRVDLPVQSREFFGSCTTVPLAHLSNEEKQQLSSELGVDLDAPDDDGVFLLRHTLMNPWLHEYVDAYCKHLRALIVEHAP
jgi:hypothetical protein